MTKEHSRALLKGTSDLFASGLLVLLLVFGQLGYSATINLQCDGNYTGSELFLSLDKEAQTMKLLIVAEQRLKSDTIESSSCRNLSDPERCIEKHNEAIGSFFMDYIGSLDSKYKEQEFAYTSDKSARNCRDFGYDGKYVSGEGGPGHKFSISLNRTNLELDLLYSNYSDCTVGERRVYEKLYAVGLSESGTYSCRITQRSWEDLSTRSAKLLDWLKTSLDAVSKKAKSAVLF